jgi:hypothetical protein
MCATSRDRQKVGNEEAFQQQRKATTRGAIHPGMPPGRVWLKFRLRGFPLHRTFRDFQ